MYNSPMFPSRIDIFAGPICQPNNPIITNLIGLALVVVWAFMTFKLLARYQKYTQKKHKGYTFLDIAGWLTILAVLIALGFVVLVIVSLFVLC